MDLEFVNCRVILPDGGIAVWQAYEVAAREAMGAAPNPAGSANPASPEGSANPAGPADGRTVTPAELSEVERAQLVAAVAAVYGARDLTFETFFTGTADAETDEVRQMAIEWWDVVDQDHRPVYQLWLCHVDCGTLFHAASTQERGYVSQFHLHDFAGDAGALEAARSVAVSRAPHRMLATLRIS